MTTVERNQVYRDHDRNQLIVAMVGMLTGRERISYPDMAERLGVSVSYLKKLQTTQEFVDSFDQVMADLKASPMVRLAKDRINELIPKAVDAIESVLDDPRTSAMVRSQTALDLLGLTGVNAEVANVDNQGELSEFLTRLSGQQINITNIGQMNVAQVASAATPQDYLDALVEITPADLPTVAARLVDNNDSLPYNEESEE